MELWEQEDVDLVAPGFIEFGEDQMGSLGFIAVNAGIDWRETPLDGHSGAEFSWDGYDDNDRSSGRGWVTINDDGSLCGHIYFHLGDDSGFRAVRAKGLQARTKAARGASQGRK